MLTATRPHALDYELPSVTLAQCLGRAVAEHADATAVIEGTFSATYAELGRAAERVAAGLRERGVRPGDRIVTQLPNWWESVVVSWGVFLAGAVLVPVVPIYRGHEMRFIIGQVRPRAVFAPASFRSYSHAAELRSVISGLGLDAAVVSVRGETPGAESLDALIGGPGTLPPGTVPPGTFPPGTLPPGGASRPEDIAVILYTSGTTSQPKGVLHSHQTLLAEAFDVAGWCRLDGGDRVFMASPLSHITGVSYGIVLPVGLGCAVVLQDRWDPRAAVELIEGSGCSFTVSATPFLRGLADAYDGRGRSALRVFVCGGADIPAELVRRASRIMGTRVVRTYGSTELPTSSMADPFGDLDAAADGEGKPMGRNEMAVRDEGDGPELLVRGPELFLGYLDPELNKAAFTDDGYFRTGDQARIETDSTVHISGRIKDIINRGGEKFSVAEVEALLLGCPSVRDVAVVGFPDPVLVERACACVVPVPGSVPTLDELREHLLAAGLAVQKAPERLLILAELPRTDSGKVQRFVLRDQLRRLDAAAGVPRPARGLSRGRLSRNIPAYHGTRTARRRRREVHVAASRRVSPTEPGGMSMSVGQNVRRERQRAGLSMRELARRLGVSASFLSQFELGQSQAAVSTLFAIATELNLSLDDLLGHSVEPADEPADSEASPSPAAEEYLAFQSGVRWRRLAELEGERVDFLLTEYEPGADSAPADQPQRHRGNDYGYVLEGTLTIVINGRRRRYKQGSAVAMRGDVPHRLLNETDKLVRTIWFVTS